MARKSMLKSVIKVYVPQVRIASETRNFTIPNLLIN